MKCLKNQSEMQAFFSDIAVFLGVNVLGVEQRFSVDYDLAGIGPFKKVQAAKQRRFPAARGAYDGECLPLFHRKTDIP